MTLAELKNQRDELDKQILELEIEEKRKREEHVLNKIGALTDDEKDFILAITEHDRSSCSDSNCCNGLSYSTGTWRCRKCMLMEILNQEHGGCYDFSFSIDITET